VEHSSHFFNPAVVVVAVCSESVFIAVKILVLKDIVAIFFTMVIWYMFELFFNLNLRFFRTNIIIKKNVSSLIKPA